MLRDGSYDHACVGDDDDIVIQAFKEQTKQYKQVYEAAKVTNEHLAWPVVCPPTLSQDSTRPNLLLTRLLSACRMLQCH